ncbi:MAG: hypothetical protein LBV16_02835, partial [Elusimicrobiota bacterium]|nr:hypothetical protein [Elusimicrobiota bacterium]
MVVHFAGATLNIQNAVFTGFYSTNEGGVIALARQSNSSITNATFNNNSASDSGGVIYLQDGATLSMNGNVVFDRNFAVNNGGALRSQNSMTNIVRVTGSLTMSNNTSAVGGAISGSLADNNLKLDLNNATVLMTRNSATGGTFGGGAIYMRGSIFPIYSSSLTFSYNYSANFGGAIALNTTKNSVDFDSAKLYMTYNTAEGNGGAIYDGVGSYLVFYANVTAGFSYNRAQNGSGGAIYKNGGSRNEFRFDGNTSSFAFSNNFAQVSGGAIYITGEGFEANSTKMFFDKNTANSSAGGAIYGGNNIFTDSTVYFTANSGTNGGAISNSVNAFTYSTVWFENNRALSNAGGAIGYGGATFTNSSVTFKNNIAAQNGGAIGGQNSADIEFRGSTVTFVGNSGSGGGALHLNNIKISFLASKASFANNYAPGAGGVFWVGVNQAVFTNSSVTFMRNTTTGSGGGIYLHAAAKVLFTGSGGAYFIGNTASDGGAVTSASSISFNMTNGTVIFSGNTALAFGGGALKGGAGSTIFLGNLSLLEFSSNAALGSAQNGGFLDSSAGAAISAITRVRGNYNKASQDGGAISIKGAGSKLNFNSLYAEFIGNSAGRYGGVMYPEGASTVSFANAGGFVLFSSNSAGQSGGALTFRDNYAATLIFDSSVTFAYNTTNAAREGGAIRIGGGIININSSASFIGNKAAGQPNDIWLASALQTTINFNTPIGRRVTMDGGIYSVNNAVTINKNSAGLLEFKGNAVNDISGRFNINAGSAAFGHLLKSTVGWLTINSVATLVLTTVNWTSTQAARFYIKQAAGMTVGANSLIYIPVEIGGGFAGMHIPVFHALSSPTLNFYEVRSSHSRTANDILWVRDSLVTGYAWTGYLSGGGFWNVIARAYRKSLLKTVEVTYSTLTRYTPATDWDNDKFEKNRTEGSEFHLNGRGYMLDAGTYAHRGMTPVRMTMYFQDVHFTNFKTTGAAHGAVIRAESSTITFMGSNLANSSIIFSLNKTTTASYGGALYFAGKSSVTFTALNAATPFSIIFASNTANRGGAISINGESRVSFNNAIIRFMSNTATSLNPTASGGGAVYMNASILTFINSSVSFTRNVSLINPNNGNGSAIRLDAAGDKLIFSGNGAAYFIDNGGHNYGFGGAIYSAAVSSVSFNMSLGTVVFSGNSAYGGGGIWALGTLYLGNLSLLEFSSNVGAASTGQSGGAINMSGSLGVISNIMIVKFNYNTGGQRGGAIYSPSGIKLNFDSKYGEFVGNTTVGTGADNGGGAFYMAYSTLSFTLADSSAIFVSNLTDGGDGGAIYSRASSVSFIRLRTLLFSLNIARYYGGAIYNSSSTFTIASSSVSFNSNSANYGGAIYNISRSTFTFASSSVSFNSNSANYGGAIRNDSNSTFTITSSSVSFNSNSASGYGGAIFNSLYATNFTIAGSSVSFNSNSASNNGGAIFNQMNASFIFVNSSVSFNSNSAGRYGGAMAFSEISIIMFANSTINFTANTALNGGGAIYMDATSSTTFTISNGTIAFNANMANSKPNDIYIGGGKLYITGSEYQMIVEDGLIADAEAYLYVYNKVAARAGINGLMLGGYSDISNTSAVWTNNKTMLGGGGGIYVMAGSTIIFRLSSVVFT